MAVMLTWKYIVLNNVTKSCRSSSPFIWEGGPQMIFVKWALSYRRLRAPGLFDSRAILIFETSVKVQQQYADQYSSNCENISVPSGGQVMYWRHSL